MALQLPALTKAQQQRLMTLGLLTLIAQELPTPLATPTRRGTLRQRAPRADRGKPRPKWTAERRRKYAETMARKWGAKTKPATTAKTKPAKATKAKDLAARA